jgi:hypothetical protein
LIEYDDWIREEEKRYSRLLTELNKSYWFTHHVSTCGGLDQSSPYKSDELNGFAKYTVDRTMDKDLSSDLEATGLTGDEILYGSSLTMDQVILKNKKSSALHVAGRLNRTSTQHLMMFQCTLSSQERNDARSVGIKMIQAPSRAALESSERESLPWESVEVESVGLVLQHWKGVRSFSLSEHCSWNKDDIDIT